MNMTGTNQVKVVVESCNSTGGGGSIHTNSGSPNAPSGYTPYRCDNTGTSHSNCPGLNAYNPAPSCHDVLLCNRFLPSGYYWIERYYPLEQLYFPVSVYCTEDKCGVAGVMRVGYLNVTNTTNSCPAPLTLYNASGKKLCGPTSTDRTKMIQ